MPPSSNSRQSPEQPLKRNNNQSARPSAPTTKPSLRFYYADGLHAKILDVLETVEQAEDSTRHRQALCDIVLELAGTGMHYYYLRPLRLAKTSHVLERSARMGINGVLWVMAPVIRNVIGRMNKPQLLAVCSHIRECME
jgi:hypothetical protein